MERQLLEEAIQRFSINPGYMALPSHNGRSALSKEEHQQMLLKEKRHLAQLTEEVFRLEQQLHALESATDSQQDYRGMAQLLELLQVAKEYDLCKQIETYRGSVISKLLGLFQPEAKQLSSRDCCAVPTKKQLEDTWHEYLDTPSECWDPIQNSAAAKLRPTQQTVKYVHEDACRVAKVPSCC
jgi:hypothetical protein